MPALSPTNQSAWSHFTHIFTTLARDFPPLLLLTLQAVPIPVSSRQEQLYYLRAWSLIYEHLLAKARLHNAAAKPTDPPSQQ